MNRDDTMQLRIHGMDCAEEVSLVKRELVPLLGGDERLSFDLLNGRLTVDLAGTDLADGDVLAAIERTGLKAENWENAKQSSHEESFWARHQRAILTGVSGVFGALGLTLQTGASVPGDGDTVPLASSIAYMIGILAGMCLVLPKAWRAIITFRPDMNLLMSIAVTGAVGCDPPDALSESCITRLSS